MSADNCIAVLVTKDRYKKEGRWPVRKDFLAYRVAYTQALDNYDYIKENEPWNLGCYMQEVWGKSKVYESYEEALQYAQALESLHGPTEYGIRVIIEDMNFYVR